MADDLTTETAEAPATSGKSGSSKGAKPRSNLLPAVVVAAGLVGGGFLMKDRSHGDAQAQTQAPAASEAATDPQDCAAWDIRNEPVEGAVAKLDAISINLAPDADGTPHYAKVGIALQLDDTVDHEAFLAEEKAYKALDVVNATIVGRDMSEFGSPQAFEALKEKITEAVRPLYGCEVLEVLFTEFVMQ